MINDAGKHEVKRTGLAVTLSAHEGAPAVVKVSPSSTPPLRGRSPAPAQARAVGREVTSTSRVAATPLPSPPPQGGTEQTARAATLSP